MNERLSLADKVELRFSFGRKVDGLWVGVSFDSEPDPILRRVEDALFLIKKYDGIRYSRMLFDLERVWVRMLPGSLGNFNMALRACELDRRFVLAETTPLELISATIVHEATHARLFRCGIGYEERQRHRVEAICVHRELAFAAKLPDGERVREVVERTLPLIGNKSYWINESFEKRYESAHVETLRDMGAPNWFVQILLILRRLRVRLMTLFKP